MARAAPLSLALLALCALPAAAAMAAPPPPPCVDGDGASYSCAQQAAWGKCGDLFMADSCHQSCGRCASPTRGPYYALNISALVSGIQQSDFDAEAFRYGAARSAVVDAGAWGVNESRITHISVRPATPEELREAARDVGASQPYLALNYTVTLDSRHDADAYAAIAARATDDALAAAANERSNMRDARAEELLGPPQFVATPTLPHD